MPCARQTAVSYIWAGESLVLHQLVQKAKSVFDGLFGYQRLAHLVVNDASGVAE